MIFLFAYCFDDIRSIDLQIKKQFPFVDVEREVAESESVFNLLNSGNTKRVYLMPQKDFERYIRGNQAIIIRPLISESPLQVIEGINTLAIEKILVDIVDDVEFSFLQGSELHYVYTTIFERHNINKSKLLRYATWRGRKQEAEQLLKINKL